MAYNENPTDDFLIERGNLILPPAGIWNPGVNGIVYLNSNRWIHATGNYGNFYAGQGAGNLAATGNNSNVGIGDQTLQSIGNGGNYNTAVGAYSQISLGNAGYNDSLGAYTLGANGGGQYNVAIGAYSMSNTGGSRNTAVGHANMQNCGSWNTSLGYICGGNYTGDENSNILIGHAGVAHEQNTMHLGTEGTGDRQITHTYLAGDLHTSSGRIVNTTTPVVFPYLTLYTDDVIFITTSAPRTINLIASPETGRRYVIKDITGSAAANHITIVPNAGNIDGAGSYVINVGYASITIVYNGSEWSVI